MSKLFYNKSNAKEEPLFKFWSFAKINYVIFGIGLGLYMLAKKIGGGGKGGTGGVMEQAKEAMAAQVQAQAEAAAPISGRKKVKGARPRGKGP